MSKRRTPEEILANMPKIPDSFTPEQRAILEPKLEAIRKMNDTLLKIKKKGYL